MNKYELVYVIDAALEDEARKAVIDRFCTDLGITCVVRDASADVGQVHYNNYVWINGDPYIVDANPGSNGKLRFGPA